MGARKAQQVLCVYPFNPSIMLTGSCGQLLPISLPPTSFDRAGPMLQVPLCLCCITCVGT